MRRFFLLAAVLAATATTARADISFVDMFRNNAYIQNGDGNSLTSNGSFLSLRLTSTGPNDYDSVVASYPGPGSPVNLDPVTPTLFQYQTGSFPDQAAMDAAFPSGTYTFDAMNNANTDSASFEYTSNHFAQTLPYLTGTDYSDLQGMNAAAAFTFHFSPYTPDPTVNEALFFFTIFDRTTNAFVYNANFLPSTTTELTVAANTLTAGHSYSYEIIFSDRTLVDSPGAEFNAQIGFDVRTTGAFSAAARSVPEPSALALAGLGGLGLIGYGRIRRKATA